MLRRICGHRREEEAGEWRKLHDEEFKNAYASPNTEVAKLRTMGSSENEKFYKGYVRKT